jgi:putative transposase
MKEFNQAAASGPTYQFLLRTEGTVPCCNEPVDYQALLELWAAGAATRAIAIHAYVLMPDHLHLLLTAPDRSAVKALSESVADAYAVYRLHRYGAQRPLWRDWGTVVPVSERRDVLGSYRYLEQNPVRSGLARWPVDYPWSSYAANALGREDELVTPHRDLLALSDNALKRMEAYREFCNRGCSEKELAVMRRALRGKQVPGDNRGRCALVVHRRLRQLGGVLSEPDVAHQVGEVTLDGHDADQHQ